jgi:hypothetical protein
MLCRRAKVELIHDEEPAKLLPLRVANPRAAGRSSQALGVRHELRDHLGGRLDVVGDAAYS